MSEPPQSIFLDMETVFKWQLPSAPELVLCYQKRTHIRIAVYSNKKLQHVRMRLHYPDEVGIRIREHGAPDKYYKAVPTMPEGGRLPSVFVDLLEEAVEKRHLLSLNLEFTRMPEVGREFLRSTLAVFRTRQPPASGHEPPILFVLDAHTAL
jgi:hypothetical protein